MLRNDIKPNFKLRCKFQKDQYNQGQIFSDRVINLFMRISYRLLKCYDLFPQLHNSQDKISNFFNLVVVLFHELQTVTNMR